MSVSYTLNGYEISGTSLTEGMYLLRETQYASSLAPRVATVEIPNIHYVVPMFDDPLDQITISLAVRLQGTDADSLRLLWNNLMGRLYMGANRPINVLRNRGSVSEQADAKLISTSAPDFDCGRNRLDATIVLGIPGGAWRGPYVEQQLGDGNGQSLTTIVNSTRPIGDAMLRVLGPMDVLEVYDATSRTGIRWDTSTTVPSLQYLLVDVASMQARIQTSQTWDLSQGTRADAGLTFIGYRPLTLCPNWGTAATTPTASVNVTLTGGAGAVTIRSRYAVV
jgi:hypothetical protein